jgi:DNA-binding winged helix-turn-helix (wHTH) protein
MLVFGSFALDERTWTLTREGEAVDLSPRLVQILAHLVTREGAVVTRDELLERFWKDTFVTENTLTRAVADIRQALGDRADRPEVIQTLARRGYRFAGQLTREPAGGGAGIDALAQWVEGRLALETLDEARLDEALASFERTAAAVPTYAPAYAGVAGAHLARYEAGRYRNRPDRDVLVRAIAAARQACAIDSGLGEAWALLGHALALSGETRDAQAAARQAVQLEPGSWRHHFRLALTSWGEARLREVDRTLALMPACAAAHLLAAMVFVARGAIDKARSAADTGALLQDTQGEHAILPAAGLHWMGGLVRVGAGDLAGAAACFTKEVESALRGRVYTREFVVNAHVSLGFLRLHASDRERAGAEFRQVLGGDPGHARATLGLALAGGAAAGEVDRAIREVADAGKLVEAASLEAATLCARGESALAIDRLTTLVSGAPPGPAGWSLGADPLFLPVHTHEGFAHVLALVASRAA